MEKGIQAGIGLGTVWRTSCQARFQWLGGVEYAYTPRISGSASARMFGGNLDANSSLVYSRYFINGRYHFQPFDHMDFYAGPGLGFDNTSFQTIRNDLGSSAADSNVSSCQEAFDFNGPSLGGEMGLGWLPVQRFGLTASNSFEVNYQEKLRYTFSLGAAIRLIDLWLRLQNNLSSAWVYMDWVNTQTWGVPDAENSFLLGFSVGF